MMKRFSTLAIAMAVVASKTSMAVVPTLALTFDTNVQTYNMSSSQEAKIQKAEVHIRDVIGSEEFRSRVLNHTYNGKKQFNYNNGLTNAQIYQKILEASEMLSPGKDNELDLKIKVYYENSSTVGYTTPSSSYINMNTKFLNSYTSREVARNMIHEWLHKIGFKHQTLYSKSRDYTVPYAIGRIMQELSAKY